MKNGELRNYLDNSFDEDRMVDSDGAAPDRHPAGLCSTCGHCRLVETARSTFYMCMRGLTDPGFRKYPPLPVRACRGYERGEPAASSGPVNRDVPHKGPNG